MSPFPSIERNRQPEPKPPNPPILIPAPIYVRRHPAIKSSPSASLPPCRSKGSFLISTVVACPGAAARSIDPSFVHPLDLQRPSTFSHPRTSIHPSIQPSKKVRVCVKKRVTSKAATTMPSPTPGARSSLRTAQKRMISCPCQPSNIRWQRQPHPHTSRAIHERTGNPSVHPSHHPTRVVAASSKAEAKKGRSPDTEEENERQKNKHQKTKSGIL